MFVKHIDIVIQKTLLLLSVKRINSKGKKKFLDCLELIHEIDMLAV